MSASDGSQKEAVGWVYLHAGASSGIDVGGPTPILKKTKRNGEGKQS
jgi:hypothetical protein